MNKEKVCKYISYILIFFIIIGICYLIYRNLGKSEIIDKEKDKFTVLSLECNYNSTNTCQSSYKDKKLEEIKENDNYYLSIGEERIDASSVEPIDKVYAINDKLVFGVSRQADNRNWYLYVYDLNGKELTNIFNLDSDYSSMLIDYSNGFTFHDSSLVIYGSMVNDENEVDLNGNIFDICEVPKENIIGGIYELDLGSNSVKDSYKLRRVEYTYLKNQIDKYNCDKE